MMNDECRTRLGSLFSILHFAFCISPPLILPFAFFNIAFFNY